MRQERLHPASLLGEFRFDQLPVSRDILDRLGDSFGVEIPIFGGFLDRIAIRFHRKHELPGRHPAPFDGKLLTPRVRSRDKPAIVPFGPERFRHVG